MNFLEATRWDDGVITGLGVPTGAFQSIAHAVSADGEIVVGEATLLNSLGFLETFAAIWDDQGAHWLEDLLLAKYGLDLSAYELYDALGVSADGRTIVGQGLHHLPGGGTRGITWLIVIPEPATASLVLLGLLGVTAVRRPR